jgi:hypothetical protein
LRRSTSRESPDCGTGSDIDVFEDPDHGDVIKVELYGAEFESCVQVAALQSPVSGSNGKVSKVAGDLAHTQKYAAAVETEPEIEDSTLDVSAVAESSQRPGDADDAVLLGCEHGVEPHSCWCPTEGNPKFI